MEKNNRRTVPMIGEKEKDIDKKQLEMCWIVNDDPIELDLPDGYTMGFRSLMESHGCIVVLKTKR